MAGVSNELSHLVFICDAGAKGRVNVIEHRVEGETDLADFGVVVDVFGRHAVSNGHGTLIERLLSHAPGGRRDGAQRTQRRSYRDADRECEEYEAAERKRCDGRKHEPDRAIHVGAGEADQHDVIVDGKRHDAVRADRVKREVGGLADREGHAGKGCDLLFRQYLHLVVGIEVCAREAGVEVKNEDRSGL